MKKTTSQLATYKIQFEYTSGAGSTWNDEPNGNGFATEQEAQAAVENLRETLGEDAGVYRVVEE